MGGGEGRLQTILFSNGSDRCFITRQLVTQGAEDLTSRPFIARQITATAELMSGLVLRFALGLWSGL